jgi:hypothetical protein
MFGKIFSKLVRLFLTVWIGWVLWLLFRDNVMPRWKAG